MTGFLGSTILEVAIGIAFIYLLLAMLSSTVNEWIASLLNARAKNLASAIHELLNDQATTGGKGFLDAFYGHPVITGLMKKSALPSYIPARSFVTAVMDITTSDVKGSITFADLENGIKRLPEGDVRTTLLALIQNANGDLTAAQQSIETWFNDAMDRASGWYKRKTMVWTVIIAAVVTLAINADTLNIARHLWEEPTLRGTLVAQANAPASIAEVNQLGQLLGWTSVVYASSDAGIWLKRLIGWLMTIVAVSMGAPFWFDSLNKLVNLRHAGPPPEVPKAP